jgi:hypothetical protein
MFVHVRNDRANGARSEDNTSRDFGPFGLERPPPASMSAFAVAIGGKADMPSCTAHVLSRVKRT